MTDTNSKPILVTGAAGFIGYHLAERLLTDGKRVVGLDSLNDYYDPALKRARLDLLEEKDGFTFAHIDLADRRRMEGLFATYVFGTVVHLACNDQPGLLSRVAAAIHDQGVQVHNARIATFGEKVEDTFLVSNSEQQPLSDEAMGALRENIQKYLESR